MSILWVGNAAGECIAASNAGTAGSTVGSEFRDREYFREVQAGRPGRQFAVGRTTDVPGLYFSSPIMVDGRFLGFVVAKVEMSFFSPRVDQADAFIADSYGVVVLAKDKSLDMRALPKAPVLRLSANTAWDLAFHCVALAHVDPAFAKYQLILLCREWFQHPNGALPAYEWNFSDVNPPLQAWAALEVFTVDEGRDLDFLSRVFDKLMINFAWWVNLEDQGGKNVYEGGFLGLDNIGPLDRSKLPVGGTLEQSDATGWMGAYSVALGSIATVLNHAGQRPASDLVLKFLEHFAAIRDALDSQGLWDETDGFYYDRLVTPVRDPGARTGPVDGGHHPGARGRGRARARPGACPRPGQAVRGPARPRGPHRHRADARAGHAARAFGRPAAADVPGRPWPAASADGQAVRRERVPVPARPAGPVGLPPRSSLRAVGRGRHREYRLRTRRVHHADVRRELQLARARSGSR